MTDPEESPAVDQDQPGQRETLDTVTRRFAAFGEPLPTYEDNIGEPVDSPLEETE